MTSAAWLVHGDVTTLHRWLLSRSDRPAVPWTVRLLVCASALLASGASACGLARAGPGTCRIQDLALTASELPPAPPGSVRLNRRSDPEPPLRALTGWQRGWAIPGLLPPVHLGRRLTVLLDLQVLPRPASPATIASVVARLLRPPALPRPFRSMRASVARRRVAGASRWTVELTLRAPSRELHEALVIFPRGRVLASVQVDRTDRRAVGEAHALARRFDRRLQGMLGSPACRNGLPAS